MNKLILSIILGTLLLVSASAMYAGESKTYLLSELGLSNITDVSITNNISEIVYSFTNESATITIPFDAAPQTFAITFNGFKEETPVVVTTSSGRGGSSHKKKVVLKNTTNVTNQTNITTPIVEVPIVENPPIEIIPEVKPVEPIINTTTDKEVKMITNTTWMWIIIGIIVFLTIVVAILIISSKKRKKEDNGRDVDEIVADALKEVEDSIQTKKIVEPVKDIIPKEEPTKPEEEKKDEEGKKI